MKTSSTGSAATRAGMARRPAGSRGFNQGNTFCLTNLPIGVSAKMARAITATDAFFGSPGAQITGSDVDRWGIGVVQEIDSAAMHLFARWQHLSMDLSATDTQVLRSGFEQRQLAATWRAQCGQGQQALWQEPWLELRRSRHLPSRRRDLLLNELTTFQIEAAPPGGFFFVSAQGHSRAANGTMPMEASIVEGPIRGYLWGKKPGPQERSPCRRKRQRATTAPRF